MQYRQPVKQPLRRPSQVRANQRLSGNPSQHPTSLSTTSEQHSNVRTTIEERQKGHISFQEKQPPPLRLSYAHEERRPALRNISNVATNQTSFSSKRQSSLDSTIVESSVTGQFHHLFREQQPLQRQAQLSSISTPFQNPQMGVRRTPFTPANLNRFVSLNSSTRKATWRSLPPDTKNTPLVSLLQRIPELQACFCAETGLPAVQIGVEIESIMEVNVEEDWVNISYSVHLDWLDLLSTKEYNRSKKLPDYFSTTYTFDPIFKIRHCMEHSAVQSWSRGEADRSTPHLLGSYQIGSAFTLIRLSKKSRGIVKLRQRFAIDKFPLDTHDLCVEFEPVSLPKELMKTLIEERGLSPLGASTNTHSPNIPLRYSTKPLYVKQLKNFEVEPCRVSGLCRFTAKHPFMSPSACSKFKDFRFDCALQDSLEPDRYIVHSKFFRQASNFVWHSMAPVLMTVVMTVSIEWIPKDETGDRLSVLMTLFLALYAHKYVLVQQINSLQTTSIEYVMLFGYVCMFLQAIVVVLSAPQPRFETTSATDLTDKTGIDDDHDDGKLHINSPRAAILAPAFSFCAQVFLMMLMVIAVGLFTFNARAFESHLKAITIANRTIIPEWLYCECSKSTQLLFRERKSWNMHKLIEVVSRMESESINECLQRIDSIERVVVDSGNYDSQDQENILSDNTDDQSKIDFLSRIWQVDLRDLSVDDDTVIFFDEILMRLPHFHRFVDAPSKALQKKRPSFYHRKMSFRSESGHGSLSTNNSSSSSSSSSSNSTTSGSMEASSINSEASQQFGKQALQQNLRNGIKVHVKDRSEMLVKRDVRCLPLEDKYRAVFAYHSIDELTAVLDAIFKGNQGKENIRQNSRFAAQTTAPAHSDIPFMGHHIGSPPATSSVVSLFPDSRSSNPWSIVKIDLNMCDHTKPSYVRLLARFWVPSSEEFAGESVDETANTENQPGKFELLEVEFFSREALHIQRSMYDLERILRLADLKDKKRIELLRNIIDSGHYVVD